MPEFHHHVERSVHFEYVHGDTAIGGALEAQGGAGTTDAEPAHFQMIKRFRQAGGNDAQPRALSPAGRSGS